MNSVPRIIATYLPQFHRVKENDEWWGEGFTEWTAVKNATPLYEGHSQPRIPLNNNYYNLLNKSVMQWQANLAKDYLVDGFCFWHYWFENGRKILEKPAENLLKWKDIDISFCFCWANETWARTWANIYRANNWSSKYETKIVNEDNGILLKQNYGDKKLWKIHFYYLLQFFKDKRYIKHKGMPVFIIFRPFLIHCSVQMIEYWNQLAINNGFPGIYFVGWGMPETEVPYNANIVDAFQCPCKESNKPILGIRPKNFCDYNNVYDTFLKNPIPHIETELLCGFVDYDNTPRNGKKGRVIFGGNPNLFQYYFEIIYKKSIDNNNPFVFVHAWNEWAEGNYLEPDTINGYKYLYAIKCTKEKHKRYSENNLHKGFIVDTKNTMNFPIIELKHQVTRLKVNSSLLLEWLFLKENKISLKNFFKRYGFASCAIYGCDDLGRLLIQELERTNIIISYIIDNPFVSLKEAKYNLYSPHTKKLPPVDVVVVTIIEDFPKIYNLLKNKICATIVSLYTVIAECK